jgi:hypothetical protein
MPIFALVLMAGAGATEVAEEDGVEATLLDVEAKVGGVETVEVADEELEEVKAIGEVEANTVDEDVEEELDEDELLALMTNPRLCSSPLMKPLPVVVCPDGSLIIST